MELQLHWNWRDILMHAWSVRWMALAGIFGTGEAVVPLFATAMPVGVFAGLTLVCVMGGIWSRVLIQPGTNL
jgi:hypothetical protein